jgi:hypothetical protein
MNFLVSDRILISLPHKGVYCKLFIALTFELYSSNNLTTCSLENFDAQCKAVS